MSDREEQGLRGPVKTCVEESTYPGGIAVDGTQLPEQKSRHKTEYYLDGRIMARTDNSPTGSEWKMRYTYDASGHLLKTASEGLQTTEIVNSYDDQGRLLSITNSHTPDKPVTFRYDERGRKTEVQAYRRVKYGSADSPVAYTEGGPNWAGEGSATTVYDEHNRPTEVQIRDAQGEMVRTERWVRTYDAQGHVTEEKWIVDNPETKFPAEILDKILEASGRSREELHEGLTTFMSMSIAYSYDAQGRTTQVLSRLGNQEEHKIETTYNEHGDKAAEITRTTQIASDEEQSAPARPELPSYHEVRYSYQYDDHANWTREIVSYRSSPDSAFLSSGGERRRALEYY